MWTSEDFSINQSFWNQRGNELAIPVRQKNLFDLMSLARAYSGSSVYLTGSTALNGKLSGGLLVDHDDDIAINYEQQSALQRQAKSLGFRVIRDKDGLVSFERFHCYVDTHLIENIETPKIETIRFLGEESLILKSERQAVKSDKRFEKMRKIVRHHGIRKVAEKAPKYLLTQLQAEIKKAAKGRPKKLSMDEFLEFQFDAPEGLNWRFRGKQLWTFAKPGQKIGDIVQRISEKGGDSYLRSLVEEPEFQHVCEPVNLCRNYWEDGNTHFLAPMILGYRFGFPPYLGTNLYLSMFGKEFLSFNHLESLPEMSNSEIALLQSLYPLEVSKGAFSSGRHRVAAMIGRLARGQDYIPISVV